MFSEHALKSLREKRPPVEIMERLGRVVQVVGLMIEVSLSDIPMGSLVQIHRKNGAPPLEGEVVGFKKDRALVIPFEDPIGVCAESLVQCTQRDPKILVGDHLIGQIIDPYMKSIDGKMPNFSSNSAEFWPIVRPSLNPLARRRITEVFDVGVRSLNSCLTFGEGQRIGIMAGSGVGKSVLLGMISRFSQSDLNVIALIGERGREVREFVEENLGPEGLKKSIVIVATGEQSPMTRVRAAHVATAIGEYFRDKGRKVLLMMDSLTRVAMAQREIGLAAGEPPTTKGYTPSVFSLLPKLLERAGNSHSEGSLTGIYTVLVEGDDFQEPVCDSARSILDGHILLTRDLAQRNHFPAVDVLKSISRVMSDIVPKSHLKLASVLRDLMAEYERHEDLISIGAYQPGANQRLDKAIALYPKIEAFLRQDKDEQCDFQQSLEQIIHMLGDEI